MITKQTAKQTAAAAAAAADSFNPFLAGANASRPDTRNTFNGYWL